MARKREELGRDLPEGELTHNPFEALRPGGGPPSAPEDGSAPRGGSDSSVPLPARKLVVRHESKGHGGKSVTCVEGFEVDADLEGLARAARKSLGAGARAVEGALVVQGKQVERIALWLEQRGYERVVRGN
jgi:translation initiation factor 1 (eIF-1/SUI1)